MFIYRTREGIVWRLEPIGFLVARMVACRRVSDGAMVVVHASELTKEN
jgi:hypothetical protein